jgi:hypothetical protein
MTDSPGATRAQVVRRAVRQHRVVDEQIPRLQVHLDRLVCLLLDLRQQQPRKHRAPLAWVEELALGGGQPADQLARL